MKHSTSRHAGRIGRPCKCTPALTQNILRLIAEGHSYRAVCGALNLSTDSLERWRRRDPDFNRQVEAAQVRFAEGRLAKIREAADKQRGRGSGAAKLRVSSVSGALKKGVARPQNGPEKAPRMEAAAPDRASRPDDGGTAQKAEPALVTPPQQTVRADPQRQTPLEAPRRDPQPPHGQPAAIMTESEWRRQMGWVS